MHHLHDPLRKVIIKQHHLGQANQESLWVQAWNNIQQDYFPDISDGFMAEFYKCHIEQSFVTRAERETALKYRYGQSIT